MGHTAHLDRLFEPRWTVLGSEAIAASRYEPGRTSALGGSACPHCGWINAR
jgi:dihydroorotase